MIKVLIVASGNSDQLSPFIQDQINSLESQNIIIDKFLIKGKGLTGYLKNYRTFLDRINTFKPNIVHAHFGLSGLLAILQRKVPVVTTFHGCDVNVKRNNFFSNIADKLSEKSIFVSDDLADKLKKKDPIVIPCGVDLDIFYPMDKSESRKKMNLSLDKKYVLFSSSFSNNVKNPKLAKEAISLVKDLDISLIELKGYDRSEVAVLMNAVDAVILTSLREGSPQFIKEAMSCNTPIISTDVGDVREVLKNTEGCFIVENEPKDIAINVEKAINFNGKTNGRDNISYFDNKQIATKIIDLYDSILIKNEKN